VTTAHFAVLPGDGIGSEVTAQAQRVLEAVGERSGYHFSFSSHLVGGAAMRAGFDPLPEATLAACRDADAVLLGAVGHPDFDDPDAPQRPEQALLGLRAGLGCFANLRPVRVLPELNDAGPLKPELVAGTDILFVRELTGGIYFGEHGIGDGGRRAHSTMMYSEHEVERIVRIAGDAARSRRGRLTSVDKANVLEVSRLWRRVAAQVVAEEYPDLEYEVLLVDAMAMHLLSRPGSFDVVVTGNMFGDILTDEASMLAGSLGLLPSASVGLDGPGLYEPVHGSAPDIAGSDLANPVAAILSAAMALRHSLGLDAEAGSVEAAVDRVIASGIRTADIAQGAIPSGTTAVGDAVIAALAG